MRPAAFLLPVLPLVLGVPPAFCEPVLEGVASWYSRSDPGIRRTTANGELFDDTRPTCATWHYPFGAYLKITDRVSGRSVVCRVNDRGPRRSLGRVVDLTKAGFRRIADPRRGLARVAVERVKKPASKKSGRKTRTA